VIRPATLSLIAVLAAPAWACEPSVSACATVRLIDGWSCIYDPAAPEGYRIEKTEARASGDPFQACEAAACVMIQPLEGDVAPVLRG
jgi:hypothetical protein